MRNVDKVTCKSDKGAVVWAPDESDETVKSEDLRSRGKVPMGNPVGAR